MTTQAIAFGIIQVIKAPITLVYSMWQFLLTPLFTINLSFLNNDISQFLLKLFGATPNFTFGSYDITLLFVLTAAGVTLFLVLKIINLLPLV